MENNRVKKQPHQVREGLTKDVDGILRVCIQHFDDSLNLSEEECFDVDAVIEGRSVEAKNPYRRKVRPAAYARIERRVEFPASLALPQKGYFIPSAYAPRFA